MNKEELLKFLRNMEVKTIKQVGEFDSLLEENWDILYKVDNE